MMAKPVAVAYIAFATLLGFDLGAAAQSQPPRTEADFKKAGYQPLTSERIRQLVIGNTAHGVALKEVLGAPAGATWVVYYPDAKAKVTRTNNYKFPATGIARIVPGNPEGL